MSNVRLLLLTLAFVFELLAMFGVTPPRLNLVAAGLMCYFAALLVGAP